MYANVGDELIIEGHRVGLPRRTGKVEETRGADGGPRTWSDGMTPVEPRCCFPDRIAASSIWPALERTRDERL